jgi:hypothetical protein
MGQETCVIVVGGHYLQPVNIAVDHRGAGGRISPGPTAAS